MAICGNVRHMALKYRYTPDEIAEQIRDYVTLVAQQGIDGMREQLAKNSATVRLTDAEKERLDLRMIGYKHAIEDMIKVFTDPQHRVYRHISVIAHQAQRLEGE